MPIIGSSRLSLCYCQIRCVMLKGWEDILSVRYRYVCYMFVGVILLCVFGYEAGRVYQMCWRCVMFVLLYCTLLCGRRCIIRKQFTVHTLGCWWLAARSRAAGYASGVREIVRLTAWVVWMASSKRGFRSPGHCCGMSFPSLWRVWM